MKRTIIIIGFAIILTGLLASCRKYLDVNAQSNYVYIGTATDLQDLLDGYTVMNTGYPAEQVVSSDEYYITDATFLSLASQPVETDLYTWNANAIRPFNAGVTDWQAAYNKIYVANLVLENVDKLRKQANPAPTLDQIQGEALFYRAYNLWAVAQLYTKGYIKASASQDAGVPVRLTSDINEKISRGTVQQTYDQVVNDLQQSTTLLPDTAVTVSRPAKVAAYAMLARVYLSMSNYTAALQSATSSLNISSRLLDYNQVSTTSATPFVIFNKEELFHVTTRGDNLLAAGGATFNTAKIDPALYNSYASQDLRKQIFFKVNSGVDAGTYRFTGNYDPSSFGTLFSGLAVDEVYITRAECYARGGDANSAMADLNTLLKTRYVNTATSPYVPLTATSPANALSLVLAERKKELIMRGLRWTDLKRLNQDPTTAITLTRVSNGITYTLPPNDPRYTLLIPVAVVSSSPIAQNTR